MRLQRELHEIKVLVRAVSGAVSQLANLVHKNTVAHDGIYLKLKEIDAAVTEKNRVGEIAHDLLAKELTELKGAMAKLVKAKAEPSEPAPEPTPEPAPEPKPEPEQKPMPEPEAEAEPGLNKVGLKDALAKVFESAFGPRTFTDEDLQFLEDVFDLALIEAGADGCTGQFSTWLDQFRQQVSRDPDAPREPADFMNFVSR